MRFDFMKGVISERVALRWLMKRSPGWAWRQTDRFSGEDMSGVDIVGTKGNEARYVQVKSSERYLRAYSPRIEVLVVPQDDKVPYLIGGVK